jgi:prophage DNA circulation protein
MSNIPDFLTPTAPPNLNNQFQNLSEWNVTDAVFKDVRFHVAIPSTSAAFVNNNYGIMSQDVSTERRLQISERSLVDGADVEDFGQKPRMFSAEVIFFGRNYNESLKLFQAALNDGKSGVLILPDLDEAVYAKFQKSTRKTSAADGSSTILSVSWVEDRAKKGTDLSNGLRSQLEARNALQKNDVTTALPPVVDLCATIITYANDVKDKIAANPLGKALTDAENAVTKATSAINSVLSIPKVLRQSILSTLSRVNSEVSNLQASVQGVLNISSLLDLSLNQGSPTRINSQVGLVDYLAPAISVTTLVTGTAKVVPAVVPPTPAYQNLQDAVSPLKDLVASLLAKNNALETKTTGQTADISSSIVPLLNSVKDLIAILDTSSTKTVMTTTQTSLLEVCFNNGLGVADVNKVYLNNTQLTDILDIPPFSVILL